MGQRREHSHVQERSAVKGEAVFNSEGKGTEITMHLASHAALLRMMYFHLMLQSGCIDCRQLMRPAPHTTSEMHLPLPLQGEQA